MFSFDSLIGNDLVNTVCEYLAFAVALLNFKSLVEDKQSLKNGFFLLWLFMTLFAMFYSPTAGDSFTSMNAYTDFKGGADIEMMHFEPVYFVIMSWVNLGYVIWRFIVWGSAAAIFVLILKKYECNSRNAFFIWAYLGMQAFYYQRFALALAMLFIGVVLFISRKEENARYKVLRVVFAIVIIGLSTFFHRSMPIYIAVSILVLFMPTKKWSMALLLIVVPIVLPLIVELTGIYLDNASEDIQDMDIYLDSSKTYNNSTKGTIFQLFKWTPYAIMIVYCVWDLLKRPDTYTNIERYFLLFAAVLYMLSFMFQGLVAYSVAGKMKMQSAMSMTMFLSLYYTSHKGSRQCNLYAYAAMFTFVVIFIYEHFISQNS